MDPAEIKRLYGDRKGFAGVYSRGLMGVWASALDRVSIWEAFLARRVYGVTGDWYYLRASQTDGQAAWVSPVWVEQR